MSSQKKPTCCAEPRLTHDVSLPMLWAPIATRTMRCACGALWVEETTFTFDREWTVYLPYPSPLEPS